ncbi:MAG: sigma-54 dependent transcriptional regulator [Gemmatimonadota bacterium]
MTEGTLSSDATSPSEDGSERVRVLIVDDEPLVRESIELCLAPLGHEVTPTGGADHARVAVARKRFDLVLLDLRLNEHSGLDLIPELLEADPSLSIVLMTAYGSVESAVEAMRRGAFDYIHKPISPSELRMLVGRISERRALRQRLQVLEETARDATPSPLLDSEHPAMARAVATARDVASTDATVLITGESGTGKGVLARALHGWSARAARPFAVVNCPSLSAELLRSELFGHVKGSFTGATENKMGKIEFADGGSLFLDEVGELTPEIQPRLLRFLQDREYERVGDPQPRLADVRLIAATNADLEKSVAAGDFRGDLYYRLNVIQIEMPPLRARRNDIPVLAESFLRFFSARYGKQIEGFSDDALTALQDQPWPGNVRELQNAVERAVILARSPRIGTSVLPRGAGGGILDRTGMGDAADLPTLEGMEERYIRHVLEVTGSIEEASEVLGVAPSTLWRRRRKYGI